MTTNRAAYRVSRGRLFVNDEHVPVNPRILRIGLVAAGLGADGEIGTLSEEAAGRILHMERAYLLSELGRAIRSNLPGRAA